jgi:phosphate starvation-inducible membrane PsiE
MRGDKEDIMMKKINTLHRMIICKEDSDIITKENDSPDQIEKNDYQLKANESFTSIISDTSTIRSNRSAKTYQSKPFNKELDFDIPDFSPTKYGPFLWKLAHCLFYFLYTIAFIVSNIIFIVSNKYDKYNIILLVAHIFYCISSFLEWWYFKRGCIGYANLNSKVKDNIDKSFKARILRGEQGWKYFFSFCAAIILVYGNCYYLMYINGEKEVPDPEYWNINLIGAMVISLAQILKLEKILMETKQYIIKNDLSNCLIEIFFFFASLIYGTIYFYRLLYNYDNQNFVNLYMALRISGCFMIFFSSICLINRYYMSDYQDLNASDLSNITL